jgi:hypothetical protein
MRSLKRSVACTAVFAKQQSVKAFTTAIGHHMQRCSRGLHHTAPPHATKFNTIIDR